MSSNTAAPGSIRDPVTDFSNGHVGITCRLTALAGLPALLAPAALAVALHLRYTVPDTLARWGHRI